jgi:site-specific recombinase XerD
MALLAARLGLRAKEIAQLTLEDVDWKAGTVELHQTKGRRSRLLPLPADAGQAMADYLRTVRAHAPARQVFLCLYRPTPLIAGAVSDAIAVAFRRAGLPVARPGRHLLHHTLATHLVQRGADLKAIADVLGQRSINTTMAYTQVNLTMLARVAQPWPKEGR